ncbi:hypothetical protein HRI_002635300 [Hibiscus trionum]|uniref:Tf2-1-like SH3-like domain-containing protein n=1 Tax=Hibiscus trionum TaxID=183268 RepID=A0A9W7M8T3_HIBTR|nr:hypothetical protein HRI_002635300 [Hibiscus trionum]
MTPFRALYGRDPPTLISYVDGGSVNPQVDSILQDRDELLCQLKHNLQHAQLRMKNQADKKRREVELTVDYWVFVRLQPYRHLSLRLHRHQKLSPRFFGPYKVTRRIGPVAYKLELPASTRIHPIFHVSQLKPCHVQLVLQFTPLPLLLDAQHKTIINLEDKVSSTNGGHVTDQGTNLEDAAAGNVLAPRKGSRARRVTRGLTEFVVT